MSTQRIYLSPPQVSDRERELLLEAFDSGWIAPLGPHVDAFEQEMAAYLRVPNAVALSSGTAALHLALILADIRPGDHVLVSSFTFAATANAIAYVGAVPVFVDSNLDTWNMDPTCLEQAITTLQREKTPAKAVITVDLYGQCADYNAINELCTRNQLLLIEDAAEALGASYHGKKAGNFGEFSILSFNGNKIMTTSGGGMLITRDAADAKRARYLATQARQPAAHYEHTEIGYNYRLSNLLAAVGRGQLESLDEKVARRRQIFDRYVAELPALFTFMPEPENFFSSRWLTCALMDNPERLRVHLEAENIESRRTWKPMHQQRVFKDARSFLNGVSDHLFERGICLPSGSSLTDEDQSRVIHAIQNYATNYAGS